MSARIYIEGGGEGNALQETFRRAWADFFEKAGIKKRPRVVRGGGRSGTWGDFLAAEGKKSRPDVVLLLVDSEDVPTQGKTAWDHLAERPADRWQKPITANDDAAHLMTVCMETWFLADPAALKSRYGSNFKERAITAWPDLEKVPKATVYATLEKATSKQYKKGEESFELLRRLDPAKVEEKCVSAKRLLDRLRRLN